MEIAINGNVTINNEVSSTNSQVQDVTQTAEQRQPIDRTNEVLISNDTSFSELIRILYTRPETKAAAIAEAEEKKREEEEAHLRQVLGEDYDLVVGAKDNQKENDLQKAKRRPGAVMLRNYEPRVAMMEIGTESVCEVYSNGYAVYDNGDRKTVVWVPGCSSYTYYFNALRENEKLFLQQQDCINEDDLGMLPWYHAVMLHGEDQIWSNMAHPKSVGTISDKDLFDFDIKPAYHWCSGAHFENPENAYIRKEEEEERRRALTDRQRKAYDLYYGEGYRQEEIAEILGINQKTVSRLLSKGRKNIKKNYGEGA